MFEKIIHFFIKFGNNVEGRKISNESCHLFFFQKPPFEMFFAKN
jgi:hypothetical protein